MVMKMYHKNKYGKYLLLARCLISRISKYLHDAVSLLQYNRFRNLLNNGFDGVTSAVKCITAALLHI